MLWNTLRNLHLDERWGDRVTIVSSDMRVWKAPEKADILVSELLGSFGDNELSPECLDGAQSFLKRDTGISIPCDSMSYLEPIMSSNSGTRSRNSRNASILRHRTWSRFTTTLPWVRPNCAFDSYIRTGANVSIIVDL